jgi:hypothetical protein
MKTRTVEEGYIRQIVLDYFSTTLNFCTVLHEVPVDKQGRVDIVVAARLLLPEISVIEVKAAGPPDARAIQQTSAYSKYAHKTYLALPEVSVTREAISLCSKEGWGLYRVSTICQGPKVSEVQPAQLNPSPRYWSALVERLLAAGWQSVLLDRIGGEYARGKD